MSFFGSLTHGLSQAMTGGDGSMGLNDYLRMAAMAGSIATGNVPAAVAMGAQYMGDATGSQALKTGGQIGSLATGIGSISGATTGAADTVATATDAAATTADTASAAATAAQGVPEALAQTPLSDFVNSPLSSEALMSSPLSNETLGLGGGGSKFMDGLKNMLGGDAKERWSTVGDMGKVAAQVAASMQQDQPIPSQLPPQLRGEDFSNYTPTFKQMGLEQFLQQAARRGPYSGAYGG
jgi:hypothetical protein